MRWDAALMGRGFLSRSSRHAMFQIHVTLPSELHLEEGSPVGATGYGYGWFLGRGLGNEIVLHPGDNAGFKSVNLVVPSLGIRLAVLVNDEASAFNSVAVDLLKEALEDRSA
jgi:CubicO group peptidase (beta-lactamase class C family)